MAESLSSTELARPAPGCLQQAHGLDPDCSALCFVCVWGGGQIGSWEGTASSSETALGIQAGPVTLCLEHLHVGG